MSEEIDFKPRPSGGPRCPNHNCPLELTEDQYSTNKGQAPCEISGALFDFEQDVQNTEEAYDKNGNVIHEKTWLVNGEE